MAVSLKHSFQSAKADGADTSIVRPSDWNAEHVLTQATGKLLGRTTAGTGTTEEISVGSNLTLSSGSLNVAASPSFTGKAQFEASVATGAKVNLGSGVNVTSGMVDGDIWVEGNNFRWQGNGVTWRASAVGHTHVSTAITDSTTAGRALLTGADASAQRTSLGLGSAALLNTSGVVQQDTTTGSAFLPAGTTAQRPASPSAGFIRYNSTTGKFEGYGSAWGNIGGGAAIGDTPPANPGAGDLWWNSADGRMYVYYTDANSSQWVDLSAGGAGQYLPLTGGAITGNVSVTGETSTGSLKVNNVPILAGPAFSAYATALQTVSGSTSTKIIFNAEEYDTHNCFDATTNYRFTPNVAGYYLIQGQTRFNSVTSYFWTEVRKNGVLYRRTGEPQGATMTQQNWSMLIYMNGTTDYVEAWHFNGNTSGTYTIGFNSPDIAFTNWFQGHLARAV